MKSLMKRMLAMIGTALLAASCETQAGRPDIITYKPVARTAKVKPLPVAEDETAPVATKKKVVVKKKYTPLVVSQQPQSFVSAPKVGTAARVGARSIEY